MSAPAGAPGGFACHARRGAPARSTRSVVRSARRSRRRCARRRERTARPVACTRHRAPRMQCDARTAPRRARRFASRWPVAPAVRPTRRQRQRPAGAASPAGTLRAAPSVRARRGGSAGQQRGDGCATRAARPAHRAPQPGRARRAAVGPGPMIERPTRALQPQTAAPLQPTPRAYSAPVQPVVQPPPRAYQAAPMPVPAAPPAPMVHPAPPMPVQAVPPAPVRPVAPPPPPAGEPVARPVPKHPRTRTEASGAEQREALAAVDQLDVLALVDRRLRRVGERATAPVVHPQGDGPVRLLVVVLLDLVARIRAGARRPRSSRPYCRARCRSGGPAPRPARRRRRRRRPTPRLFPRRSGSTPPRAQSAHALRAGAAAAVRRVVAPARVVAGTAAGPPVSGRRRHAWEPRWHDGRGQRCTIGTATAPWPMRDAA